MSGVFTRATRYEVTAWPGPRDSPNRRHYVLNVEWRGDETWCVIDDFGYCYQINGTREHEPRSSNRDDDFIVRTRFPFQKALRLAQLIAPKMTVGGGPNRRGMTAVEMWKWERDA